MKQLCTLLFILFIGYICNAQTKKTCVPCLPQGADFIRQSQVDSFPINYPNCTQIGGYLSIRGNITNLSELGGLTSIGGAVYVEYAGNLNNLNGLNNITTIGGILYITGNNSLTSLNGLNNLTSVGSYVEISWNQALTSLSGLESLTSIGGYLSINDNHLLTSLSPLGNLTSINGGLGIFDDNQLTNLTGLEGLTSISDVLAIGGNPTLTSLTGLNNLTSIGGGIELTTNYNLTDVTGMNNVTSVGGDIRIVANKSMTNLIGFNNINAGSICNLTITDNDMLSNCAVKSICDYLANPNGTVTIQYNFTGCTSQYEVEDACAALLVEPIITESLLTIYPNPTSNKIIIETNTTGDLSVLNIGGKQLLQQKITEPKTQLDISTLPSGVYVVRLTNDKTAQVGKFVKQ